MAAQSILWQTQCQKQGFRLSVEFEMEKAEKMGFGLPSVFSCRERKGYADFAAGRSFHPCGALDSSNTTLSTPQSQRKPNGGALSLEQRQRGDGGEWEAAPPIDGKRKRRLALLRARIGKSNPDHR
jgi:hypothetical protein